MAPRAKASALPEETRLDDHLNKPSTTAPGDGPADTTDPTEHASSAQPDKAAAAKEGHGTVNAVVPVDPPASTASTASADGKKRHRVEEYDVEGPDGPVRIRHNIDTGETERV